jgi:hypothetical protein
MRVTRYTTGRLTNAPIIRMCAPSRPRPPPRRTNSCGSNTCDGAARTTLGSSRSLPVAAAVPRPPLGDVRLDPQPPRQRPGPLAVVPPVGVLPVRDAGLLRHVGARHSGGLLQFDHTRAQSHATPGFVRALRGHLRICSKSALSSSRVSSKVLIPKQLSLIRKVLVSMSVNRS